MSDFYDVAIIGSGPGGYVAAIKASQLGLKVVLIEKAQIGGICLNWGCIPTKALLRSAEVYELIQKATNFGVDVSKHSLNLKNMIMRSKNIASKLSNGVNYLLSKNKVKIINGKGTLVNCTKIAIEGINGERKHVVQAKKIIIATGAKPKQIPGLPIDGKVIWDYKHALRPNKIPKKLIIIGSGAIGIEFASFYNAIGSEVYVVEIQDRILPVEDKQISDYAKIEFQKKGINFFVGASFELLEKKESNITLLVKTQEKKQKISAPSILVAVGVVGNSDSIGLEELGIKNESGSIITNEYCETNVEGIFAIGDVTAPPWLAHKAMHEGVMVAEILAGKNDVKPLKKETIPGCTYSNPQIASFGLTEDRAIQLGHEINIGNFPFLANGKALAMGEEEGFVKTIFDKNSGELLGAHMVGSEVTELISSFLVGKELETTSAELIETIFPHPTMSEMLHESVMSSEGKAIHY